MFKPGIYALHYNGQLVRWDFSEINEVNRSSLVVDYWMVNSQKDLEMAKTDAKQLDSGFSKIFS